MTFGCSAGALRGERAGGGPACAPLEHGCVLGFLSHHGFGADEMARLRDALT